MPETLRVIWCGSVRWKENGGEISPLSSFSLYHITHAHASFFFFFFFFFFPPLSLSDAVMT